MSKTKVIKPMGSYFFPNGIIKKEFEVFDKEKFLSITSEGQKYLLKLVKQLRV